MYKGNILVTYLHRAIKAMQHICC